MDDSAINYLKLQYEIGFKAITNWIDSRYKTLQFTGYFNGAILTLGFGQHLLLSKENVLAGVAIGFLSLLVALLGLSTEIANRKYNISYFAILRDIEEKFNPEDKNPILEKIGVFSYGKKYVTQNETILNRLLMLDRIHKIFYSVLIIFWAIIIVISFKIIIFGC